MFKIWKQLTYECDIDTETNRYAEEKMMESPDSLWRSIPVDELKAYIGFWLW